MTGGGPSLRLTHLVNGDRQLVEVSLEEPGVARRAVSVPFAFELSAQDRERLRWYFEDYLEYPADPSPRMAASVEARMAELGKELFRSIFADDDARDLWVHVRDRLASARVEVLASSGAGVELPWELLWDPRTNVPLAIRAAAFTRGYANPAQPPRPRSGASLPVRILLVICRPAGGDDVPFRSVASRLTKGLGERHRGEVLLEVLRPPTFMRLAEVLRLAAEDDPYDIVHFDGHGEFELSGAAHRGSLIFEREADAGGVEKVDGARLGALLAETDVSYLVLNACRSARADVAAEPGPGLADAHARVRAYGSVALDVMDAGVAGVVAMQHNVYVATAAHFVGNLYATLARGQTLGQAVSLGRKQLHAQPRRDLVGLEVELRDWPVPVVYEAGAVQLFPSAKAGDPFATLQLDDSGAAPDVRRSGSILPTAPDAGFFGRDETLLALDRAFDHSRVVLLNGYAGSGKTATAAEFARWYSLTGGTDGPILFNSFESYTPLARVLDEFARVFRLALEASSIRWLVLTDEQRREICLKVLERQSVLWIWDNVEPVAGFPTGADSAWSAAEQAELARFLRDLRGTEARVLLTSRRDERAWLGDVPVPVNVPPMPFHERVQLARSLALRLGSPIENLEAWRPLLDFTQGNPLTITVVVGEAVRQRLASVEQLRGFTTELRRGAVQPRSDRDDGRNESLRASLSYGFKEAFDEQDRRRLALLHVFDRVVFADLLAMMGGVDEYSVPALVGVSETQARRLLDRAAEIGQLTAAGDGVYAIHPALPAYFTELFERYHPGEAGLHATRAFCRVMAQVAQSAVKASDADPVAASRVLQFVERDLVKAYRLSGTHRWMREEISLLRGLQELYEHQGRWVEWGRLEDEFLPRYVDLATDMALPGRDEEWYQITQWRVRFAFARSDLETATHLQQILTALTIKRAESAAQASAPLEAEHNEAVRGTAIALNELGNTQTHGGDPEAIATLERAVGLAKASGDAHLESGVMYSLAVALLAIPGHQDLDRAEALIVHALEMQHDTNTLFRSRCFGELGFIALQRMGAAIARQDEREALKQLETGIRAYEEGLRLTPADAEESLASKHLNLGTTYGMAGDDKAARGHWNDGIRFAERSGQVRTAARCRMCIARSLAADAREPDAAMYADRALRDLVSLGPQAESEAAAAAEFLHSLSVGEDGE